MAEKCIKTVVYCDDIKLEFGPQATWKEVQAKLNELWILKGKGNQSFDVTTYFEVES